MRDVPHFPYDPRHAIPLGLLLLLLPLWHAPAFAQCAPAPDSPYFFRNLAEQRAEAKLAEDRGFFESLLSEHLPAKGNGGKPASKREFIDHQLASHRGSRTGFYAVRDFRLDRTSEGHGRASYRLVEGDTGNNAHVTETWQREVYEVQEGKWRLRVDREYRAALAANPRRRIAGHRSRESRPGIIAPASRIPSASADPSPKKNFSISNSSRLRCAGSMGVSRYSLMSMTWCFTHCCQASFDTFSKMRLPSSPG